MFPFQNGIRVESFAEVQFSRFGMTENCFRITVDDDLPGTNDVTAIGNRQRFSFTMVGKENGDSRLTQIFDDILNTVNGDGIDTGEGLVEQNDLRITGKTPSNF